MYAIASSNLRLRFLASVDHAHSFFAVMLAQNVPSASNATFCPSCIQTELCTFADHGTLELSKHSKHLHQRTTACFARVHGLGNRFEFSFGRADLFHRKEQIFQASAQPIELPDNQGVTFSQLFERPFELRLMSCRARYCVQEDLIFCAA